jgi:hypothetical protein
MTQTDPFGNEQPGAPTTASGVQFSADTLKQASLGAKLAVGGAVVAFIGYFLPWAKVSSDIGFRVTVSGSDADAILVLLGALAVGALAVVQLIKGSNKGMAIGATVAAGLALLITLLKWSDLPSGDVPGMSVSTGIGLYLCALASVVMCAGTGMELKNHLASKSA